ASRAMAIVHIAIFDAINAVLGQYRSYTGIQSAHHPFSTAAAVGQAAHDTLVSLFPSQKASFDQALADDLLRITGGPLKQNGVTFGKQVAAAILAMRVADGAEIPELHLGVDYSTSNLPGHWRQDPISLIPIALGAHWGGCKPFVVKSTSQFEPPPPPALTSAAYTAAYTEAKNFGGDGTHTPTQRTPEQTFIGTFWAYDGTPSLCAPPRLYNQITVQIADQTKLRPLELARLLALINATMATCVPTCHGVFLPYRRLKKKMAKAGFISASIGTLIRREASPREKRWQTTSSITLFFRFTTRSSCCTSA